MTIFDHESHLIIMYRDQITRQVKHFADWLLLEGDSGNL